MKSMNTMQKIRHTNLKESTVETALEYELP
jgi:hypothetical protein